uniref:Retrovirus-related Pol polyprotein from transposon TNT 1-94 n=1 Tax=Cajanus cajan TaxID=3821 RepID=A0A151U465_CAJCA|nr:Retrovirus-related Pol polyprotein from transposon TNT 1-94 [Cajanus cajan]
MKIPQGYKINQKDQGNLVCKLNRSLYGLKQASRQWFKRFSTSLKSHGFIQCISDYSLFSFGSGNNIVYLLVYVDDIILAGPSIDTLQKCQNLLHNLFKLNVVGDLKYFLGLEIAKSNQGIHLCQRKYNIQLLEDTSFSNAKPAVVPMDPNQHFNSTDGEPLQDLSAYRRLLGRLMYISISRPDVCFAVNKLSQFMSHLRTPHLQVVHQVLRYLKATPGQGIFFSSQSKFNLSAYVDADWGSCVDNRRSTIGFCIFMGDSLLTWK